MTEGLPLHILVTPHAASLKINYIIYKPGWAELAQSYHGIN